jgi:large subunit ribosomal protein L16
MLIPKKYKYRKMQRGSFKAGPSKGGNYLSFGEFGLVASTQGLITSRQLEATRVCINRELQREGKLWIRIFPQKPMTKRAAETRMGSGKGEVEYYCAIVKPGRILFEIGGVTDKVAREAMRKAQFKLPIRTRVLAKKTL